MKRTVHFLSVFLLSLHLSTGCDGNEKKQSSDSISCLITEYQGTEMARNYRHTYASTCGDHETCGLLQQGWVSKEVVQAMVKLLRDNDIVGYRVYFTAEKNNSERFSDNDHKKGISFTIVPTRDTTIRETNTNSIHVDVWDKPIPIASITGHTLNVNINIGKEKTSELRRQFDLTYRRDHIVGQTVDSLSKSVWYSEACLNEIYDDLRNDTDAKGLLFLPGAYFDNLSEVDDRRGRKYTNQSTVILVTADEQGQPKWQKNLGPAGASPYNHGELCPQKCPPGN